MRRHRLNWGLDQPSNDGGGEDCVEIREAKKVWNDLDCDNITKPHQALCEVLK